MASVSTGKNQGHVLALLSHFGHLLCRVVFEFLESLQQSDDNIRGL